MKKIFLMMLGAIVAFASCQKSELDGISDGGMVDVTLSASMATTSATTRADESYTAGDGTTVDRCILEVYTGDVLYKRMVTSVGTGDAALTASFDLRLVSSQTYEFLLWADKDADETVDDPDTNLVGEGDKHYITTNTDGLKGITTSYESYVGNDEKRDAFYYYDEIEITASTAITAELTRPFGQVNVKTYLDGVPADMYPASVKVEYATTVGNTFDVSTGVVSNPVELKWSEMVAVIDGTTGTDSAVTEKYIDLSTDYIFASKKEQDLHKFTMYFYDDEDADITSNDSFVSIPVQQNYKTNVSGELLTKGATINVEITPTFETTPNDVTVEEAASISDANSKLAAATDDISLTFTADASLDDSNTIVLPASTQTGVTSVTLDLSSITTDEMITIENSADGEYAKTLYIIVSDTEQIEKITVDAGSAHVVFYGTAGEIIVSVSDTTFVVEEGASIETLTITKGNVEIYGEVGEITVDENNQVAGTIKVYESGSYTTVTDVENYTLYDTATTYAEWADMLSNNNVGGVMLISDITLTESFELTKPVIIEGVATIDGGDCTLTMNGTNNFSINGGELSISNCDITANTTVAPFYIISSDSSFAMSDVDISQAAVNNSIYNGAGAVLGLLHDSYISDVNISLKDSNIWLLGYGDEGLYYQYTYSQSAINLYTSSTAVSGADQSKYKYKNFVVEIDNTDIITGDTNYPDATCWVQFASAVTVGNIDNLELTIKDSKFEYMGYPLMFVNSYINSDSVPSGMELTIDNSEIYGWCAINLRTYKSTINIINGSTLVGCNRAAASGDNGFSTILMSGYSGSRPDDPALKQIMNTTINIEDSTIIAESYSTLNQHILDERNNNSETEKNIVNIKGNSALKVYDKTLDDDDYTGPSITDYYIKALYFADVPDMVVDINIDSSVTFDTNIDGLGVANVPITYK